MTREPLMLTDTAMVLLREYLELGDDGTALLAGQELYYQDFPDLSDDPPLDALNALGIRRQQIVEELLLEMSILWVFPDIPIVRHLDWHLILDEHVISEAERTLKFRWIQVYRQFSWGYPSKDFIKALLDAYQEAFAAGDQAKTTP